MHCTNKAQSNQVLLFLVTAIKSELVFNKLSSLSVRLLLSAARIPSILKVTHLGAAVPETETYIIFAIDQLIMCQKGTINICATAFAKQRHGSYTPANIQCFHDNYNRQQNAKQVYIIISLAFWTALVYGCLQKIAITCKTATKA